MIESFKHKGLKRLYEKADCGGIHPKLVRRVEDILSLLNIAEKPEDVNLPGYHLHKLVGDMKDFWSITVRANWRIIFRFENGNIRDVELIDYH
ncbi:MAG: type II toxin-antitoxin system RelE/ParE family toxin [Alphaproteobacteria bacterium]|nr:type II toxin-antitoxin system RelE/ParE family toxin [Alphaproteobacteria bacterium]